MSYSDFTNHKAETQAIIDKHKNDFTSKDVNSYIQKAGGYAAYVRSLGGVFTKYIDFKGKVSTYEELSEIGDYVWGLYDIWGVDYSNGCSYTYSNNIYKAKAGKESRFYLTEDPKARFNVNYAAFSFANGNDLPGVDEMLGNPNKYYAVVNCGLGVVQMLKKAGLCPKSFPDPAEYPKYWKDHGYPYKLIKNTSELEIGDVLYFFRNKITNRNTIKELPNWASGGYHTAIVGEKNDSGYVLYDSGHAYTYYGEFRNIRKFGDKPYQWATDWIALRFNFGLVHKVDLTKTAIRLAIETLEGKYGSGNTRKKNLGNRYNEVQTLIDKELKIFSVTNAIIDLLAQEVLTGYWGSGDARKNNLKAAGYDYSKVQARVNILVEEQKPKNGWVKDNNKWYYYKDNKKLTGLNYLEYNGQKNWYYFDKDGIMQTGTITVSATLTFDSSGRLIK